MGSNVIDANSKPTEASESLDSESYCDDQPDASDDQSSEDWTLDWKLEKLSVSEQSTSMSA